MSIQDKMISAAERYLKLVPAAVRRRGKDYFESGRVLVLDQTVSNSEYKAVVQGSEDYDVSLVYQDNN